MHATLADVIADTAQNSIEAGAKKIEVSLVEDGATISETAAKVRELGGLYIAAHIDRPNFSVLSALGNIPEPPSVPSASSPTGAGKYFDAVELSRTADETEWLPKAAGYAVTRSSDAHNLDDVARVWTEADLPEFSIAALKAAFAAKSTRISPRLTAF